MPTRALRFVLVMLVVLGSGVGLAAAEQETTRAITPGLHKKRVPATRANLNELDSGTEKAGSEDNTTPPDRGGVSEQTRREVERQRIQREARKKRQRENREKRQKRTDEINRKARNKELYRLFTANLWVLLLCVVLLCGCVIAINDIRWDTSLKDSFARLSFPSLPPLSPPLSQPTPQLSPPFTPTTTRNTQHSVRVRLWPLPRHRRGGLHQGAAQAEPRVVCGRLGRGRQQHQQQPGKHSIQGSSREDLRLRLLLPVLLVFLILPVVVLVKPGARARALAAAQPSSRAKLSVVVWPPQEPV